MQMKEMKKMINGFSKYYYKDILYSEIMSPLNLSVKMARINDDFGREQKDYHENLKDLRLEKEMLQSVLTEE